MGSYYPVVPSWNTAPWCLWVFTGTASSSSSSRGRRGDCSHQLLVVIEMRERVDRHRFVCADRDSRVWECFFVLPLTDLVCARLRLDLSVHSLTASAHTLSITQSDRLTALLAAGDRQSHHLTQDHPVPVPCNTILKSLRGLPVPFLPRWFFFTRRMVSPTVRFIESPWSLVVTKVNCVPSSDYLVKAGRIDWS